MSKLKFIREASMLFVAAHYKHPDINTAISYAEKLGEGLTHRGYGTTPKNTPKTRKSINYYAQLTAEQKTVFDRFWLAFAKKDGKQRAVNKFIQLWGQIKTDIPQFIEAASNEATLRTQRDTTPPWAERWLTELRWTDYVVPQQNPAKQQQDKTQQKLNELQAELKHFKWQLKVSYSEVTAQEIEKIQSKINKLKGQT